MRNLTPDDLAELRRLAELARDLPCGSDWLHGEVADGTETVSEWMGKCSASPGALAAGRLHLVWSEGSGETKVNVHAIVGDTETAPIRAAFMANANPATMLALLDAAEERDALRSTLSGRCLADITHRDEEHRQSVCMLPAGHAPLAHDDCMGCTWTDAEHWELSDGLPVVTTVGDLTARHIGRRVRLDDCYDAKLETIFFHEGGEVSLNFTHPEGFTYGCSRPLDTPCEVLP